MACEGAVLDGTSLGVGLDPDSVGAASAGAESVAAGLAAEAEPDAEGTSVAALTAAGEGVALSGVQAARAAIPTPAVRKLANTLRLGIG